MGEIKAELNAELQTHIAFEIPLFGGIPVPESAVVSWAIIVVLTLLAIWLTHGLRKRPGRKQIAAEMLVGFINNFCRDTLGDKYWRTFAPYLGTVGLYLALANMAGLFGVTPPTKDLNVTAGLAIMSALLIYGSQFRFHGLRGGLKKFSEPFRSSRRSTLWRSAFGLYRSACDCSATFSPDSLSWSWSKWPFRSLSPFH